MNQHLSLLAALISGLVFGLGMAISGMIDPAKIIAFLDVAGDWDSSLAFVMGGALLVFLPSYFFLIKPRTHALNNEPYCLPVKQVIDRRLIIGAAIFGLGWGIGGLCPGPAVTSLFYGSLAMPVFITTMVIGALGAKRLIRGR